MVYPIQRQFPNNRFSPQTTRPANTNGLQQIIKSFSKPNSPIASLATKGFGNISKTLTNVDQVLKVVQSATPIVQEYGPMVKNLPAMYRMVKALSKVDNDEADQTEKRQPPEKETTTNKAEVQRQTRSGQSTPKLYI